MDGAHDGPAVLVKTLRDACAVLIDFDGPVTDLFGGTSTAPVAAEIKESVGRIWGHLDSDVEDCDDSHAILHRLRDMIDRPSGEPRSPEALEVAERIVTRYEYEAAKSAEPSPGFARVVDALLDLDLRLVIVSNNSEGPIWEFLKRTGLQSKFEAVVGRDPRELRHMKPDPDSVRRALRHLHLPPAAALLVGDQMTDLEAARTAGTGFLGYTRSSAQAEEMMRRGADGVIDSHTPLIEAARSLHGTN